MLSTDIYKETRKVLVESMAELSKDLEENFKDYKDQSENEKFLLAFSHIFRDAKGRVERELLELNKYIEDNNDNNLELRSLLLNSNYFISTLLFFLEKYFEEEDSIKILLKEADSVISNKYLRPTELRYIQTMISDLVEGSSLILSEEQETAAGVEKIYPAIIFISDSLNADSKK